MCRKFQQPETCSALRFSLTLKFSKFCILVNRRDKYERLKLYSAHSNPVLYIIIEKNLIKTNFLKVSAKKKS